MHFQHNLIIKMYIEILLIIMNARGNYIRVPFKIALIRFAPALPLKNRLDISSDVILLITADHLCSGVRLSDAFSLRVHVPAARPDRRGHFPASGTQPGRE